MRKTRGQKIFNIYNIAVLTFFSIVCIYPFLNILAISLNEGQDAALGGISIWPRKFTLYNYQVVFGGSDILHAFLFSGGMTIIRTAISLLCITMAAYAFTKKDLLWKPGLITFFLIPMFIGGGLIPYFLLIRTYGLMNNFLIYILPAIFDFYSMVIIRVYFDSNIPESLSESAFLDGATDFDIFFRIYIPLSKPILAAMALFIGVGAWNDWFTTMLFCNSNSKLWTLQFLLQKLVMETENARRMAQSLAHKSGKMMQVTITPQTITYATLMIATIPILLVYPFLQKYFVSGMMLGSIKG